MLVGDPVDKNPPCGDAQPIRSGLHPDQFRSHGQQITEADSGVAEKHQNVVPLLSTSRRNSVSERKTTSWPFSPGSWRPWPSG